MNPSDEIKDEALHTYQDLTARFGVHYSTVWRWFRRRRLFKPTAGTVRIAESEVQKFITENTQSHAKKKSCTR